MFYIDWKPKRKHMIFHIVKFGGGCLRSAKDVKRLLVVLRITECNIIVVSAFYGMTNVLVRVAKKCSFSIFSQEFLEPHRMITKELGINTLEGFFQKKEERVKYLLSLMDYEGDNPRRCYAEIVAMGEDFAQAIVTAYLTREKRLCKIESVDARNCIIHSGDGFVDVSIDQNLTTGKIQRALLDTSSETHIRVVQGFLAGSIDRPGVVSLMRREGSDLTAALFAASFYNPTLTYCKRFPNNGKSLVGNIGIAKFFKHQQELGTVIVSPEILSLDGLPPYFRVIDFENPDIELFVVSEGVVLEKLRQKESEDEEAWPYP